MNNLKSKLKSRPVLLLLFAFIVIIAIFLIVRFLLPGENQNKTPEPEKQTLQLEQKVVLLAFSPNTITASNGGKINADITIDAGDAAVSYVKLDISYDPEVFSNVTLTPFKDPTSALSYSLIPEVDTKNSSKGSIVATYTLINGAVAQKGKGVLAKFSAVYKGGEESTVTIFPDSTVATKDSSYTINVGRVNLDVFPR